MNYTRIIGVILGVFALGLQAMDSQFGYYQSQDLKVDINLRIENDMNQAVMAELRSNHFDKTFCPTMRVPVASGKVQDLRVQINGRCVYGKYNYILTISGGSEEKRASKEIIGGYEESTINSIPVELNETYVISNPAQGCREFCTIQKANGPK